MPGGRSAPTAAGAHFLVDRALIAQLVAAAPVGRGDLVLDLGAGLGALTAPLSRTGALVVAVERDPRLAALLRRRFAGHQAVRVVQDDLRAIALPRRRFFVVASPPFGLTTWLCRRLLGVADVPLAGAELILSLGSARRLAAAQPRDAESAWWAARYDVRLVRRAAPWCFAPPPRTAAAHVRIRPRAGAGSLASQQALQLLIRAAFRRPCAPLPVAAERADPGLAAIPEARIRRALIRAGVDPRWPASRLTGEQWPLAAGAIASQAPRP